MNTYSRKQYISLLIILLTWSVSVCIGVVHSVFMKLQTTSMSSVNGSGGNSSSSSSTDIINSPIVCNRLNSIPSSDTHFTVRSKYYCLGTFAIFNKFYIYLITAILYFMDVTQFNIVSFLYGFDQTSIEDIPLGIRYSNVLAIPILEMILFFGVNANVLFRFYCICCCGNKEYIRSYRTYEDKQLSCNIVLNTNTSMRSTSQLLEKSTNSSSHNMTTVNDSSTNISSSGASTARNMTHIMTELDEYFTRPTNAITSIATHNVSSASFNACSNHDEP